MSYILINSGQNVWLGGYCEYANKAGFTGLTRLGVRVVTSNDCFSGCFVVLQTRLRVTVSTVNEVY